MRPLLIRYVLSTMLLGAVAAASSTGQPASQPTPIAFRDITVVSPHRPESAHHMTAVVSGERIADIGPADEVVIPAGAMQINGTGKFLIPGLIDMHTHLSKARKSALSLFIVNGVTTLRDMGGDYGELATWRQQIRRGSLPGPDFLIAGPYLESARNLERMRRDPPAVRAEPFERTRIPVGSPAEAQSIVSTLAAKGIDFLKIRTFENTDTYRALHAAADRHGLKLVGHVAGLDPELVLAAGHDGADHPFYPSVKSDSAAERLAVWKRFAERGIPMVPTLVTLFRSTFPDAAYLHELVGAQGDALDKRRRYLSRYLIRDWREQASEIRNERTELLKKIWNETVRRDLREMHEAGMSVLVGSDVGVLNIFPGSSTIEEMELLASELRLTPMEVLDRTTRRSAQFLGMSDSLGTIERGKLANIVVLGSDPTANIANVRSIEGLVLKGRYFPPSALERLRRAVLTAQDLRTDDWGRR